MNLPNLGHAVIINNVVEEMPGSAEDVEALKTTYEKVGFNVQVHTNCTAQVWLKILVIFADLVSLMTTLFRTFLKNKFDHILL